MNFKQFKSKLKHDRKFQVIFIIVVLVVGSNVISSLPGKKEIDQATCDPFNGGIPHYMSESEIEGCLATGCGVDLNAVYDYSEDWFGWLGDFGECMSSFFGSGVLADCVAYAPNGERIITEDRATANIICEDDRSKASYRFCTKQMYLCLADDNTCESSTERQMANMLDSIWEDNPFGSCKTKFYVVTYGGGFLALMMMMAML